MALVFYTGFDYYQTADLTKVWTSTNGSPTIAASGRTGQGCEFNANNEYIRKGLTQRTAYRAGAAIKCSALPPAGQWFILSFDGATLCHVMIAVTSAGAVVVYRGGIGVYPLGGSTDTNMTSLGSSAGGVVPADTRFYLEAYCLLGASSDGAVTVRVNGSEVLALTSVTTDNSSATGDIAGIGFGYGGNGTTYLDDVYVTDTTGSANTGFLGDVTAEAIFPVTDAVAEGSNTDFTCSDGSDQGAMVDESSSDFPDEDSTYLTSGTPSHRATFHYPDMSVASGTIFGVQVCLCAKKTDSGTRTYTDVVKLSGGSNDDGTTSIAPSDLAYSYGLLVRETKPGGGDWTVSAVNGAEFGVKVVD